MRICFQTLCKIEATDPGRCGSTARRPSWWIIASRTSTSNLAVPRPNSCEDYGTEHMRRAFTLFWRLMVVVIADSYVYTVSLALGWGGGIEMSFVAINGMPARTSTSIFSNTSPSKKKWTRVHWKAQFCFIHNCQWLRSVAWWANCLVGLTFHSGLQQS